LFQQAARMISYFSHILIFTLVLTAPLSFCGENCPDFKPACEIRAGLESKSIVYAAQISAARAIVFPTLFSAITGNVPYYSFIPPPPRATLQPPLYGRAPPNV